MLSLRNTAHPVLTDEGGAILDENTGRWTHLTPTACTAVLLLLSGNTPEHAAERYAARYGIPLETARADVTTVASHLAERGLTHTSHPPEEKPQ